MIRLASFLLGIFAVPALAETSDPPATETCQSCTARHNALKKLQDARVPPPEKPLPEPSKSVEPKDD